MPSFIKTEADEERWAKAKGIVNSEYHKTESDKNYWQLVNGIYQHMAGHTKSSALKIAKDAADNWVAGVDAPVGVGGVYLINQAIDPLTGQKTLYHGTSNDRWEKIREEGLRPERGGSGWADVSDVPRYKKNCQNKIHVTERKDVANYYSRVTSGEPFYKAHVSHYFGPGAGKRIKLKVNYDKFDRMEPDPDSGIYDNASKGFAARTTEPIHPNEIYESVAADKERYGRMLRYFPKYLKKYPIRFAAGVGMASAGIGALGYAAKDAYERHKSEEKSAALTLAKTAAANMDKTVVFDFDGVIHEHSTNQWKGVDIIEGAPIPGIGNEIGKLRKDGFDVVVVSARCAEQKGINAIQKWLAKQSIKVDGVQAEKPPARAYVDDRAINFDGNSAGLAEKIENFVPWSEKRAANHSLEKVSRSYDAMLKKNWRKLYERMIGGPSGWMKEFPTGMSERTFPGTYHGTSTGSANSILKSSLQPGHRGDYGPGAYMTGDYWAAKRWADEKGSGAVLRLKTPTEMKAEGLSYGNLRQDAYVVSPDAPLYNSTTIPKLNRVNTNIQQSKLQHYGTVRSSQNEIADRLQDDRALTRGERAAAYGDHVMAQEELERMFDKRPKLVNPWLKRRMTYDIPVEVSGITGRTWKDSYGEVLHDSSKQIIFPEGVPGNMLKKASRRCNMNLVKLASNAQHILKTAGVGWDVHGYKATPRELDKANRAEEQWNDDFDSYVKTVEKKIGRYPESKDFYTSVSLLKKLTGAKPQFQKAKYDQAVAEYAAKEKPYFSSFPAMPASRDDLRVKTPFDAQTNYKLNDYLDWNYSKNPISASMGSDFCYCEEPINRPLTKKDIPKIRSHYQSLVAAAKAKNEWKDHYTQGTDALLKKLDYLEKDPSVKTIRLEME